MGRLEECKDNGMATKKTARRSHSRRAPQKVPNRIRVPLQPPMRRNDSHCGRISTPPASLLAFGPPRG